MFTYFLGRATFDPNTDLAYNTTYTATITTGVKDLAGNAMVANKTWSFTTGTKPDTTAPTVTSTSPADNATNVAASTPITAMFSDAMDSSTITATSFTLKDSGNNPVSGAVTYSGTTRRIQTGITAHRRDRLYSDHHDQRKRPRRERTGNGQDLELHHAVSEVRLRREY